MEGSVGEKQAIKRELCIGIQLWKELNVKIYIVFPSPGKRALAGNSSEVTGEQSGQ